MKKKIKTKPKKKKQVKDDIQKTAINLFYGKGKTLEYVKKMTKLNYDELKEVLDLGGEEIEKEIGVVGVDSGQVIICDPCYIDSQWKNEELEPTPAIIQFPDGHTEEVMCLTKRWFELVDRVNKGELKIIQQNGFAKAKNNFSYPACAEKTLGVGYGQLNYELGHAGVGVVSESGWGDGCYPVYATIEKETGRIKALRIQFF